MKCCCRACLHHQLSSCDCLQGVSFCFASHCINAYICSKPVSSFFQKQYRIFHRFKIVCFTERKLLCKFQSILHMVYYYYSCSSKKPGTSCRKDSNRPSTKNNNCIACFNTTHFRSLVAGRIYI